jgi:hypothetical protein
LRQALVVPIQGLLLKIAAVPVDTPFLLSNTLLRAIGATVDTANHVLHATKLDRSFPLILTGKGLFLLDLNDLAKPMPESTMSARPAETHTTVSEQTECASSRAQQSQACQHVQKPKKHHVSRAVGFVDGNGATGESHNDVNSKDQDTHEASRSVKSGPNGKAKNSSSDLSKALPQSFQVLRRDGPVDSGEETPESPAASGGGQSGSLPILTGSAGDDVHQLRKDPPGEVVQSHVEPGTSLGALVHPTLQQEPQARTSDLHYVNLKVEHCEMTGDRMPVTSASCQQETAPLSTMMLPKAKMMPKAKPQATPSAEMNATVWDLDEESQDLFEVIPGEHQVAPEKISSIWVHLESRMLNMENALERVIQFIEQQSHQHAAEQ